MNAARELDVPSSIKALLDQYGFDRSTFEVLRERLARGEANDERNRLTARVEAPHAHDIEALPALGSQERKELDALGSEAIRAGKVAAVVLAGGMATRFGGVVKAAVEVARGKSFLDLKLADIRNCAKRLDGQLSTHLMTSFATHKDVTRLASTAHTEASPVSTFAQFISLRLNTDGSLFLDAQGQPSLYAPGHGDLSFALRRSGTLKKLLERGVAYIYMSNVDNLAATLDPAIIGAHIRSKKQISVEAADKAPGDKGGAPVRVDDVLQIVEGFRFPKSFDQDQVPVFNTNSFVIDTQAIDRDFELDWFAVKKEVDQKPCVQFERLVGQLTAFLPCHVLSVTREGDDGRFMPVKDPPELEARRSNIIRLLEQRGAL
jgi:UTP--glucose-1-phosphate uridylyltransferase